MALAVALVLLVVGTILFAALLAPGLFVWAKFATVPKEAMEVEAVGQQCTGSYRVPGRDGVATVDNPSCSSSFIGREILSTRPGPPRWC
jgi:hypothetical protein